LNWLSELVDATGGLIDLDKLPGGDPTLSAEEIIGNESQETVGMVIAEKDIDTLQRIAERERSPMYTVGDVTNDHRFTVVTRNEKYFLPKDERVLDFQNSNNTEEKSKTTGAKPMDYALEDFFGSSP